MGWLARSTEYEIGGQNFRLNNENWSQIGSDLFGQGSYWKFGHLFSLSGDGSSVIISNKFGDGGTRRVACNYLWFV